MLGNQVTPLNNPFDSNACYAEPQPPQTKSASSLSSIITVVGSENLESFGENYEEICYEEIIDGAEGIFQPDEQQEIEPLTLPIVMPPPQSHVTKPSSKRGQKKGSTVTLNTVQSIISTKRVNEDLKAKTEMEIMALKKTLLEKQIMIADADLELKKLAIRIERIKLDKEMEM